jgi:hypothetical protein
VGWGALLTANQPPSSVSGARTHPRLHRSRGYCQLIGKWHLRVRQKFNKGLQVAWFRDVVRPRILKSEPIVTSDGSIAEIHVLTSETDALNLLWALKSFYQISRRRYGLCIHDDGTLKTKTREMLKHHFPVARVLNRELSERDVLASLAGHPRCREFRLTNHLSPKVFDFRYFLNSDRMLLLDSDVLFFTEPIELLRRIENPEYKKNSVNGDVASAYTVDPDVVRKQCNVDLIERFNSGLGVIHKESLNLDWIEEFLALPDIIGNFWRIEQTLYALCSSRFGTELLPSEYDVFLEGELGNRQSRHYVGAVRHLMYKEGIRKLAAASHQWTKSGSGEWRGTSGEKTRSS